LGVEPGNSFSLSVCICTRNRPNDLRLALESIRHSADPVHEVIVSDDSTTDETERLLQEYPEVVYVRGPRVGLGANRNSALRPASGSHVLFIDDDVILSRSFVHTVRRALEGFEPAQRERVIVTGPENNRGRLVYPNNTSFLGFQRVPYQQGESLRTIVINCTVFPRSLFERVTFDEQLVYGYDEVDVAGRAVQRGYRIVLCDQAVNEHYPSAVNRDYYNDYREASRLYVTLKRYALTEKKRLKAISFMLVSTAHTLASAWKRDGIRGWGRTWNTLRIAAGYYLRNRQYSRMKHGRAGAAP
jgi:glycosyltransferase involved in cell wall biosynthesis